MEISQKEFKETYIIGKFLGEGSFGNVHEVTNKSDGAKYALKRVLLPQDESQRNTLLRERDIMQKLKNKNVVECLMFAIIKEGLSDFFYMIIELCSKSLRQWIDVRNSNEVQYVNRPQEYQWIIQMCEGIKYLHEFGVHGIIHRDIKPDNVLISRRNTVKISDLGLAIDNPNMSHTAGVGTQMYKPSEQEGTNYSKGVDIYPLGIILYELLTIIPKREWKNVILALRQGNCRNSHQLQEMEKRLIKSVLSSDSQCRPQHVDDVIEVITSLSNKLYSNMDITPQEFNESYSINSFVGEGTFGKVYKAKHRNIDREYAVKMIRLPKDEEKRKNVLREAECLRGTCHENIIQCFHLTEMRVELDDFLYIVLELCVESLRQWIDKRNILNGTVVNRIQLYSWFSDICLGVQYLHESGENGIIYRDLKPGNILLTKANTIKISDFGLATLTPDESHTQGVGTSIYKPPEQRGDNYQTAADIFPLGLILFELLTIVPVDQWREVILDVRQGIFPSNHGLKEDEKSFITALLEPNPENRPNDLDEVLDAAEYVIESPDEGQLSAHIDFTTKSKGGNATLSRIGDISQRSHIPQGHGNFTNGLESGNSKENRDLPQFRTIFQRNQFHQFTWEKIKTKSYEYKCVLGLSCLILMAVIISSSVMLPIFLHGGKIEANVTTPTTYTTTPMYTTTTQITTTSTNDVFKVLVVGGHTSDQFLNHVELFNPYTGEKFDNPVNYPHHVANHCGVGDTFCGGSDEDSDYNTCYRYDADWNSWNKSNSLTYARIIHTCAKLENGSFWVAGGRGEAGSLSSTELGLVESTGFSISTELPQPMYSHCISKINDTHFFIAGNGKDPKNAKIAYIVRVEDEDFIFTPLPSMNIGREASACGTLIYNSGDKQQTETDTVLIVAGGEYSPMTIETYSFENDTWTFAGNLPRGFKRGAYITAVSDMSHPLLLIGGMDEKDSLRDDFMELKYENGSLKVEVLPGKLDITREYFAATALYT